MCAAGVAYHARAAAQGWRCARPCLAPDPTALCRTDSHLLNMTINHSAEKTTAQPRGPQAGAAADASDGRNLKGKRGLQRLINAARYSRDGLVDAWTHEDAFRQEIVLAAIMIPVACVLPVTLVEKILLIAVVLLVLIVELLNTGIEAAIDRDSFEINPLGKRAKDLGSAAVLIALLLAAGTWLAILVAHFLAH
jgi:diacylglycerol kinase (ATP)